MLIRICNSDNDINERAEKQRHKKGTAVHISLFVVVPTSQLLKLKNIDPFGYFKFYHKNLHHFFRNAHKKLVFSPKIVIGPYLHTNTSEGQESRLTAVFFEKLLCWLNAI